MNLQKHLDYFNPLTLSTEVTVIGTGATGSHIITLLTRLGIETIKVYDFDTVDSHNLANQHFRYQDIEKLKTQAVIEQMKDINPDIFIQDCGKYENQPLQGVIFLCIDNMELTNKILTDNQLNFGISLIINTRIGLQEGQVRTYSWDNHHRRQQAIKDSDFKNEEAEMPTSVCGATLGIIPTVYMASAYAVSQMILWLNKEPYARTIVFDTFKALTQKC